MRPTERLATAYSLPPSLPLSLMVCFSVGLPVALFALCVYAFNIDTCHFSPTSERYTDTYTHAYNAAAAAAEGHGQLAKFVINCGLATHRPTNQPTDQPTSRPPTPNVVCPLVLLRREKAVDETLRFSASLPTAAVMFFFRSLCA